MNTYAAQDLRPSWAPKPYTQGQADLIKLMASERDITTAQLLSVFPERPSTFAEGSKVIEWLKAQTKTMNTPSSPAPSQGYDGIAPKAKDGKRAQAYHYALTEEDGTVKFYRVKAGRNPNFYFVDAQASDDYYPIRNFAAKHAILKRINADRDGALALYGREVGRCGRCNRTLTSEYRKLGIGPVCIDK
jgi:uncharacterized protein DUF6011